MKTTKLWVLALLFAVASLSGCWQTGVAEKVGTIIHVGQHGKFVKTWEFEIIRGGLQNGGGGFGVTPAWITVEDTSLLAKVQDAFDKQYEVRVRYSEEALTLFRSDSEDKFLVSIEPFKAENPAKPHD